MAATPASPDGDAHGQAALLLVESLIHGLVARNVLPIDEACSIMEVALDAQIAILDEAIHPSLAVAKSVTLLSTLLDSLRVDARA